MGFILIHMDKWNTTLVPAQVPDRLPEELPPLTEKQQKVFVFLFDFFCENRFYPTQREIMQHFGIKGSTAAAYLGPLTFKGYVEKTSAAGRNLKISERGMEFLKKIGRVSKEEQPALF